MAGSTLVVSVRDYRFAEPVKYLDLLPIIVYCLQYECDEKRAFLCSTDMH